MQLQSVSQPQSLKVTQDLIFDAISTICYVRGVFDESYFTSFVIIIINKHQINIDK